MNQTGNSATDIELNKRCVVISLDDLAVLLRIKSQHIYDTHQEVFIDKSGSRENKYPPIFHTNPFSCQHSEEGCTDILESAYRLYIKYSIN